MKLEAIISLEGARSFFSFFLKFKNALLFKVGMTPQFNEDGEHKTLISIESEPFLFKDLEKFLKENYPEAWEEFFQEKKEVIDVQQT